MAYKPSDWLGPLIESDVQAVIAWYQNAEHDGKTKRDPDGRHQDDGSNFRSEVGVSTLPDHLKVQLLEVLSVEDSMVFVSDGYTKVKARLEATARSSLEAEIDGPLGVETKGDIFAIRSCVVVSSPVGRREDLVQLLVKDISYDYHLRKIAGAGTLVAERPLLSELLHNEATLRYPAVAEEPQEQWEVVPSERSKTQSRQSALFETQAGDLESQLPVSQPSPTFVAHSPQTHADIATQVRVKRRKPAPNMALDGVELAAGVNLDRPTAAIPSRFAPNTVLGGPVKPATVSDSSTNLLNVLGKGKAQTNVGVATGTTGATSAPAKGTPPSGQRPPMQTVAQDPSDRSLRASPNRSPNDTAVGNGKSDERQPLVLPSRTSKPHWRHKMPQAQRKLLDSRSSWFPSLPGRQFPHPNVPIDLLRKWNEQAAKGLGSTMSSQPLPVASQTNSRPNQPSAGGPEVDSEDSSCAGAPASDSDELLSWPPSSDPQQRRTIPHDRGRRNGGSQPQSSPPGTAPSQLQPSSTTASPTPPSTAQQRQQLPPDSSLEEAVLPRALGHSRRHRREQLQSVSTKPRAPAASPRPPKQHHLPPQHPPFSSQQRLPHPLPSRPAHLPSPEGMFAPARSSNGSSTQRSGSVFRRGADCWPPKATTGTPRERGADCWSSKAPDHTPRHSERQSISNPPSSVESPAFRPSDPERASSSEHRKQVAQTPSQSARSAPAPPSTAATIIKATQMSSRDTEDHAKKGVARPSDPNHEHQKRRSGALKGMQRRKWIKTNYNPDPKKPFNLGALSIAYKRAHPQDQPRLSDLAEAYKDVFPDNTDDDRAFDPGPDRTASSGLEAQSVALTTGRSRSSPVGNAETVVETPARFAHESKVGPEPELKRGSAEVAKRAIERQATEMRGVKRRELSTELFDGSLPTTATRSVQQTAGAASTPDKVTAERRSAASATATVHHAQRPAERDLPRRGVGEKRTKHHSARTSTASGAANAITNVNPSKTNSTAPSDPYHHAWFINQLGREQRMLKDGNAHALPTSARTVQEEKDSTEQAQTTPFQDFASAWRNLAPAGASATNGLEALEKGNGREAGRGRGRTRLEVLAWEL